jgi:hypothetical protein
MLGRSKSGGHCDEVQIASNRSAQRRLTSRPQNLRDQGVPVSCPGPQPRRISVNRERYARREVDGRQPNRVQTVVSLAGSALARRSARAAESNVVAELPAPLLLCVPVPQSWRATPSSPLASPPPRRSRLSSRPSCVRAWPHDHSARCSDFRPSRGRHGGGQAAVSAARGGSLDATHATGWGLCGLWQAGARRRRVLALPR